MLTRLCVLVCLMGSISLTGCTTTPPRDGAANVPIDSVIRRLKCEIKDAIFFEAQRTPDHVHYPLLFLKNWAAKVHLTIIVDDTASINPGATVIYPWHGSTTQTFSLGLGVGLSTEAVRTEDVEFLLSFSDMETEFRDPPARAHYNDCQFPSGILLESDLHLGSLINSAIEPVYSGTLKAGHDVGPGPAGAAIPAAEQENVLAQVRALKQVPISAFDANSAPSIAESGQSTPKIKTFSDRLVKGILPQGANKTELETLLNQKGIHGDPKVENARHLLFNASEVTTIETRTQSVINNIVKPLYAIAVSTDEKKCLAKVAEAQNEAITWSASVSLHVVDVEATNDVTKSDAALKAATDAENKAIKSTRNMSDKIKDCKPLPKAGPKMYDPIDEIAETVNFYITGSGSITPTWKLVQATAPLAPTFLSASRKDTNTLILTMGRPTVADDGTVSASAAMNNQILSSILSQSLNTSLARPQ